MTVQAEASPSLALVKYWGKTDGGINVPATTSIAIGLEDLQTTTRLSFSSGTLDDVTIGGVNQQLDPYLAVIDAFRQLSGSNRRVSIQSDNSFPTAAGIASSSSGFAALALGLDRLFETELSVEKLSSLARLGSGSASRAVYGGFTEWKAGSEFADHLYPASHWPELRVLVAVVSAGPKPVGSREGMNRTRDTSPIYGSWVAEASAFADRARTAIAEHDFTSLGTVMRESYLMMFSTMFTARPPVLYWLPESVGIIHEAEAMRADGVPVWETMDAGPQVKLLTVDSHLAAVRNRIRARFPSVTTFESSIGGSPRVTVEE